MRQVFHVRRAVREQQAVEGGRVVRAQPGEQGHVVRPGEDVHRVDLQGAHAGHGEIELTGAGGGGTRPAETLGRERDPARLADAEGLLHPLSLARAPDTAPRGCGLDWRMSGPDEKPRGSFLMPSATARG